MEKSLKSVLSFTLGQAFSHKVITAKKLTRALVEIEPIISKDKLIEFVDICINGKEKEKEETVTSCIETEKDSIKTNSLPNKCIILKSIPEYKYSENTTAEIHIKSQLAAMLKTALNIGLQEAKTLVDNVPCILPTDNTEFSPTEIIILIKTVSEEIDVAIESVDPKCKKYKGLLQCKHYS